MILRRKQIFALLMYLCCFSCIADDKERIYIEHLQELFMTKTVYPQEKREYQFTLSGTFVRDREEKRFGFNSELEYGLTDHWQVGIEWEAFVHRHPAEGRSASGLGGLGLETQYSFMNIRNSQFHVALGFELGIPVGSSSPGLTEGVMEYAPYVVVARDFPNFHHVQLFAQAGLSFVDRVRSQAVEESNAHNLGVSFGFLYPARWAVFSTEFTWEYSKWNRDGDDDNWFLTPGVTFNIGYDYQVGLGLPIGLKSATDSVGAVFIITRQF